MTKAYSGDDASGLVNLCSKSAESFHFYMAVWSSLVARLAHNQEVVGSNPTIRNHNKGAPSNLFLMKKFLAQLVEQLSAKQCVVGSSPTKSFQPRLVCMLR